MKRRSKSSPPSTKRTFTEPGTPGPFTSDLARDQRQRNFPRASPTSTQKSAALRKQLFSTPMVVTRSTATLDTSSDSSEHTAQPAHRTPPDQHLDDIIVDELPRAPREPRQRDPPDLHDVVTQQTEILAGMLGNAQQTQELEKIIVHIIIIIRV